MSGPATTVGVESSTRVLSLLTHRPELSKASVIVTLSVWPVHGPNTMSLHNNLASIPLPYVLAAAALTALGAWRLLAPRRADRRGVMRPEGNRTAVYVIGKSDRSPQKAYVLNRTSGGARLAVKQDVPVGTALWLRAEHAPSNAPWAEVTVRRREEADGHFAIDCQFQGELHWTAHLMFDERGDV